MVRKAKVKISLEAHNELEAAAGIVLGSEHGILLDEEDKKKLRFADDSCGKILRQSGVSGDELGRLSMKLLNTTVSEAILALIGKYGLSREVGYAIARKHMEFFEKEGVKN